MFVVCYPIGYKPTRCYDPRIFVHIEYIDEFDLKSKIIYKSYSTLFIYTRNGLIRVQHLYLNFNKHTIIDEFEYSDDFYDTIFHSSDFNSEIHKHMLQSNHENCSI